MTPLSISFLKKRKFFIIFLILLLWFFSYFFIPLNISEENASFEIDSGKNLEQITDQLIEMRVLKDSVRFKFFSYLFGKTESLKKGHYQIGKSITPYELLQILANGREMLFSIKFIEGTTFDDLILELKNNEYIKHEITSYTQDNILNLISADEKSAEGIFFPDTYYFYKNTSDIEILRNSYKVMKEKSNYLWDKRDSDLPYKNIYEALIMASIIEKEVGVKDEAPLVAGVFVNRLNINMPLQSDPTVIYGMRHRYDGNIRKTDLVEINSYNTYTQRGLPPSPIATPSLSSIIAALNPTKTDALYFVAKGDRTHQFSATLKEHNRAVREYQRK
ncbi:MAG: endolytic transglycosylase MltG [Proteobacteria bacterium]|nr:endolytic transglycosylase MltG [Pseudomonadota bacterium]